MERKYKTVQIKKETHAQLQEYCNEHGYKMSRLIDKMIKEHIIPSNVMRVIPNVPPYERFKGNVT